MASSSTVLTLGPQRFGTAGLSGIDIRDKIYFFQTPNYQGAYGRIYPIIGKKTSGLGLIASDELERLNTWDNHIFGGILVHGDGVITEGDYTQSIDGDNVTVTLDSLEAIIDNIFVKNEPDSDITWVGPADRGLSFLATTIESAGGIGTTLRSSRLFNDLQPVISTSGNVPGHILLATRQSGISTPLNIEPENKTWLQLQRHIDQKNPHGLLIKQDDIVTSGITIFSGIEVFNDVVISGLDFDSVDSVDFPGALTFSDGVFHNDSRFLSEILFTDNVKFESTISGTIIKHIGPIIFDHPDNSISGLGVKDGLENDLASISIPGFAETIIFGDLIQSGERAIFKANEPKEFAGQEFLTSTSDGVSLLEHHRLLRCHISGLNCKFIEPDADQTNEFGTIVYTASGGLVDGVTPSPTEDDPFGGRITGRDDFASFKSGKGPGTNSPFIGGGGFYTKEQQFWLNILDDFEFNKVSVFIKLRHPQLREFDSTWAGDHGATAGTNNNLRISLKGINDNLRVIQNENDSLQLFEGDLLRSNTPTVNRNNLGILQDTDSGLFATLVGDLGRGNEVRTDNKNLVPFKTSLGSSSSANVGDLDILTNNVTPETSAKAQNANKNLLDFFAETGKRNVNSRRQWILNFEELTQFIGSASPVLEEWGLIFEGVQFNRNPERITAFEISGIGFKGKEDSDIYQKLPTIAPSNRGFVLQGDLDADDGVLIDGIDVSTLAPLKSGVNVDSLHTHKLLPDIMYAFSAPFYKNATMSGNELGLMDGSRFDNQNWLDWYSIGSGNSMIIHQIHVPEGAEGGLRRIGINARSSGGAEFTQQAGLTVLLFDTDGNSVATPNTEFYPSRHGTEILLSGNDVYQTISGTWEETKSFDLVMNLRSTSGIGIHVGRIKAEFLS